MLPGVLPGPVRRPTAGCELVGDAHGAAPPSDHFGLVAELAPGEVAAAAERAPAGPRRSPELGRAPASRHTALVLMPPPGVWGPLQRVRCALDAKFRRWPPHVTLLFPFVDESWLDPATAALASIAAELAPFELAFDRAGPINPRTTVLWPTAAAARAVDALHARLRGPFAALLDPGAEHLAHLTRRPRRARPQRPAASIDRSTCAGPSIG